MNYRKWLFSLAVLASVFSLTACRNKETPSQSQSTQQKAPDAVTTPAHASNANTVTALQVDFKNLNVIKFSTFRFEGQILCKRPSNGVIEVGDREVKGICTYQSWGKPKVRGEGEPDMEIRNGSFIRRDSSTCSDPEYTFIDKGLKVKATFNKLGCRVANQPSDSAGYIDVFVNNVQKQRYWSYFN